MHFVATFESYTQPTTGNRKAFNRWINILNDLEYDFTKERFLNTSDYLYFFPTHEISSKDELISEMEVSPLLKYGVIVLNKISTPVCCYVGVKNNVVVYGFTDADRTKAYPIGRFKLNKNFLHTLTKYQVFKPIALTIMKTDIDKIKIAHQIKDELKMWWPHITNAKTTLLDDFKIRKRIPKKCFNEKDLDLSILEKTQIKWAQDKEWFASVGCSVVIDEDFVDFFFKLW